MPEGDGTAKGVMYANSSGVGFSGVDFQIGFGIKKNRTPGSPASPDDVDLFVYISPQQAKGFIQACNQALQAYEEIYGEINITPDNEVIQKVLQKYQQPPV